MEKIINQLRIDTIKGIIDDVAISGNLLRLERMNEKGYWLCIYLENGERFSFNCFVNEKGELDCVLQDSPKNIDFTITDKN